MRSRGTAVISQLADIDEPIRTVLKFAGTYRRLSRYLATRESPYTGSLRPSGFRYSPYISRLTFSITARPVPIAIHPINSNNQVRARISEGEIDELFSRRRIHIEERRQDQRRAGQ